MRPDLMARLIEATSEVIVSHADQLTALDQAIGDGDHGANMARGFREIAAQKAVLAALPLSEALKKAGMTLVMKVGGAAGPLYGSLLIDMGKAAPEGLPTLTDAVAMLEAGIDAVKRRGKSESGEKTMLDVLCPVAEALRRAAEQRDGNVGTRLVAAAAHALHRTSYLKATKGRASFLGERSIGHMDPGARSAELMVAAVCRYLEYRPEAFT